MSYLPNTDAERAKMLAAIGVNNIKDLFVHIPQEVQDAAIDEIKQKLKVRRTHLEKYASEYYKVLHKTVLVVGTDKKDKFVITRLDGGKTKIEVINMVRLLSINC